MIRRPPRSTLFPYRRSSDLVEREPLEAAVDGVQQVLAVQRLARVHARREAAEELRRHDVRLARPAELGDRRPHDALGLAVCVRDRKSTRLNSSHANISYAVF